MKYTVGVAMNPLDQLAGIAKTAEECGFSSIALPDSLFFMETQAADYPYTPDGSRMWNAETPWVDPLIAAAAMGAVTEKIDELLASTDQHPEALIFPAVSGGHQRHDVFTNSFKPALKRCGLENSGITPHSLRHFAGTHLAKANANLPEIKKWMGDSSTTAVMRYLHATDRTATLVEAMEHGF